MQFSRDFAAFARGWQLGKNQTVHTRLISDTQTPVSAMLKLGAGRPYSFLLESVEGGAARGRYSIIGRDPDLIWRVERGGKVSVNRRVQAGGVFEPAAEPPLASLRALLDSCRIDDPDQPQPMAAGLFGYLGYDMARQMETLPDVQPMGLDVPEAVLIRPTLLAIFDQIENSITLVTPVWFDKNQAAEAVYKTATERLKQAQQDLNNPFPLGGRLGGGLAPKEQSRQAPTPTLPPRGEGESVSANMTEDGYVRMVERAKDYIAAGDIFQVVLSQRFSRPFAAAPFELYRAIRRLDPSPFLYYFDFDNFSVVGSSPEILVRVRDNKVTIRPIAGTRPRAMGNRSDTELAAELLADPKELAEHLMLLDLGRNDIGRVAKTGSVRVTARNDIEYYKHVMHIVSNVEGELDRKFSPLDALIGGFPAGTVSGAPKVRAMEIIAELEPDRRGVYAGCMGYFGANGSMDTCIAIRTAVIKDGMAHVQAGAGIVYDSDARAEYRECVAKARGMLKAVEETLNVTPAKAGIQRER